MAQFRATIRGQRGEASRLGSKSSGLNVSCNGWDGGVRVIAEHDDDKGDKFLIYATTGSSARVQERLIGTVNGSGEFTLAGVAK